MKTTTVMGRINWIMIGILASLAVALTACGGAGGNPLADTTWELASLTGNDLIPGTTITVEFAADELSGRAGCNHYGGIYQVSSDSLSVGDLFATEMACPEPAGVLDQESHYLAALQTADSFKVADDRLEIFDGAGGLALLFLKPGAGATASVEATPVQSGELEKVERLAPIDRVEVQVDLSSPPSYSVTVASGLPNGCFEFDRLEVTAEGHRYQIAIYNLETLGIACTERYGTVEHGIPLGNDLEPNTIYTLQINDWTETFVTEEDASSTSADPTPTPETPEPGAPPAPPAGWKSYQDSATGVTVQMPESWVVTQILPNQSAILQSYPEDKYVGGEAREPGDTKCDLTIRPADVTLEGHMGELRSNPALNIISDEEIVLQSGQPGFRVEVESMGLSISLITDVDGRVVVLTCFGELVPFDQMASTVSAAE
jgi:heat shock protein HslJ